MSVALTSAFSCSSNPHISSSRSSSRCVPSRMATIKGVLTQLEQELRSAFPFQKKMREVGRGGGYGL